MRLKIRRAAVLGSGVMGAQIAAHLAAAGVRTYLLDLATAEKDAPSDEKIKKIVGKNVRSMRSILAIENLKTLKPPPLASPKVLANIIPGNFEDDFSVLADADWIIEAVIERLDIKGDIHKRIEKVARPGVPVTTNTSGIPLAEICKDLPEHYAKVFFGTHFFNPPRYMRLLEIIPHEESNVQLVHALSEWISARLGKGIVYAKDTINFIANRVGVLAIHATLKHMQDLELNIETVDELTGPLIGHPKSATFRTMDVVGLDTLNHVAGNVVHSVKNDPFYAYFSTPEWLAGLIAKGHLGQKSNNVGCYKKSKNKKGETEILSYSLETKDYVAQNVQEFAWMKDAYAIGDLAKRMAFIFSKKDPGAELIWRLHRDIFCYSALLVEQIAAGSPKSLDEAMRWGFNWEMGPFEMWQGIGVEDVLKRMQSEAKDKVAKWLKPSLEFYRPSPVSPEWQLTGPLSQLHVPSLKQQEIKRPSYQYNLPKLQNTADKRVVDSNKSASIVDLGDGVACLVFHSKMNTINDAIIEMLQRTVAIVNDKFDGLVIGNEGENFSAGANLKAVAEAITSKQLSKVEDMVRHFQGGLQLIKFAPFPSVSCPFGLTLGGGCEVSLHTTETLLHLDTFSGLVEMGVGLIPAGGGTKELALRAYRYAAQADRGDPTGFLSRAFMLIGMAKVSGSGQEAIEMGLYPMQSSVTLTKDRQIMQAKQIVLNMLVKGYAPPTPERVVVVGDPGIQTFKLMLYNMAEGRQISAYDALIAEKVATVLCGGTVDAGTMVSEQQFLDLERQMFLELCEQPKTLERITHMLSTGKPLRN